jgi:uncharacterized protein
MKPVFKLLISALLVIVIGIIVYARLIEPHWIRIKSTQLLLLPKSAEADEIKILHLADFHYSDAVSLKYLKSSFEMTVREKPDLICLTGDYISKYMMDTSYSEILKILSNTAPTYACPGNHDGGLWARRMGGYETTDKIKSLIQKSNIHYLENEFEQVNIKGVSITIGGIGDLWAGNCLPEVIQDGFNATKSSLKIILTHNPDSKNKLRSLNWNIMLAGHTHGGQIELPIIGAPFAPVRDKVYLSGLYKYDNRYLYVTPGVGNLHGFRFNCRPEISVINLVK